MRVLIVDDQPDVRETIRRQLLPHTTSIDVADGAETAAALAEASDYDVMLIDVIMPGEDGVSLIRRLRGRGVTARIVAMSGGSPGRPGLEALASAAALGADAVLFKPFGTARLLEAVTGGTDAMMPA